MKPQRHILNFSSQFSANTLSMAISLATTPFAARVLGPQSYGEYNLAVSFAAYAALFSGLGFSTFASREVPRLDKIDSLVNVVITLKLIFGFIAFLAMIAIGLIVRNNSQFVIICFISGLTIVVSTFDFRWVFISKERMVEISYMSLIGQIIFAILLFFFVNSSKKIIIYSIIMTLPVLTPTIMSFFLYIRKFQKINFTLKYDNWKTLIRESIPLSLNQIAIVLNMYFASLIIGLYFNSKQLGLYSAGFRLMIACNMLLNLISTVMVPPISRLFIKNRIELIDYLRKYFFICICFGLSLGGFLFLTSDLIVNFLLGTAYKDTSILIKIWGLGLLPLTSLSIFSVSSLIACNGSRQSAVTIIIGTVITISSLSVLLPSLGIIGGPISNILMELTVSIISIIFLIRILKLTKDEIKRILNFRLFIREMAAYSKLLLSKNIL